MLAGLCKHKAVGSLDITHDKSVKPYKCLDLAAYTAEHGLSGSNSAAGELCQTLVGGSSIPAQFICDSLLHAEADQRYWEQATLWT